MADYFEVKLIRTRVLSESTRDFRFVCSDNRQLQFEPGQFYRFLLTDDQGEFERSYSLCNFETDAGESILDLVISQVDGGRATKLLFAAEPGLKARVAGPFGRLILPSPLPRRLFLVATSVGIAPYMPMLKPLLAQLSDDPMLQAHLLFGVRDRSEFLYRDALLEMAKHSSQFHVHVQFSREQQINEKSEGLGYVQTKLQSLDPDPETDYVLLCGNPRMIDECYDLLKGLGFKARQVRREKYVFARETTSTKTSLSAEQKALIAEKMKKYQR